MNSRSKPKGAVAVFVAACLVMLFGFLGLAVDVGYTHVQKTRLQNLADAAALACVIRADDCGSGGSNLFPEVNPLGLPVTVTYPVSCPDPASQQGCARAIAQTQWSTFFMHLLGQTTASAQATAVAGRSAAMPSCVTTLNTLRLNGSDVMSLTNCSADLGHGFDPRTTSSSGIQVAQGSSGSITVYNGADPSLCQSCSPAPVSISGALPQLPIQTIPTTDLDGSTLVSRAAKDCQSGTCLPGIYTGKVTLKGATTLHSGNYVFLGGLDTGGQTVRGTAGGVSLYIPGSEPLSLTGDITLVAPTPGGCSAGSGLVISHPLATTPGSINLGGAKDKLNLTGVINLSADQVTIGGSAATIMISGTLVANSIRMNGNVYPKISANPCNNIYQTAKASLLQ